MSGYTLHLELDADTLDGALTQADLIRRQVTVVTDWTLTRDGDWGEHAPGTPDYNPGLHARVGDPDPNPGIQDDPDEGCPSTPVGDPYFCTRETGHDLQHIAGDGTLTVATWWDKP